MTHFHATPLAIIFAPYDADAAAFAMPLRHLRAYAAIRRHADADMLLIFAAMLLRLRQRIIDYLPPATLTCCLMPFISCCRHMLPLSCFDIICRHAIDTPCRRRHYFHIFFDDFRSSISMSLRLIFDFLSDALYISSDEIDFLSSFLLCFHSVTLIACFDH